MPVRIALLALALLTGGCANTHVLAQCKGPLEALNPDEFHPPQSLIDGEEKLVGDVR